MNITTSYDGDRYTVKVDGRAVAIVRTQADADLVATRATDIPTGMGIEWVQGRSTRPVRPSGFTCWGTKGRASMHSTLTADTLDAMVSTMRTAAGLIADAHAAAALAEAEQTVHAAQAAIPMASERQVAYIASLLRQNGSFGPGYLSTSEYWQGGRVNLASLRSLTRDGASQLIDSLTEQY